MYVNGYTNYSAQGNMYIIMIEYMYNNVVNKTHIIREILKKAIVYSSSGFFPSP